MNPFDLHSAADNELTAQQRDELRQSLTPSQLAELESIKDLKAVLQSKCEKHTCDVTWKRCVGRLDEIDRARKTERFVGKYAWALCGVFFAAILVGGQLNRNNSGGLATMDVARVASVLDSRSTSNGTDSADMKRFRDFVLGSEADLGKLQVRGAAEFVDQGRLVQVLRLADVNGNLNLFRFPGQKKGEGLSAIPNTQFSAGMIGDANCVAWEQDGALYLMAGKRTYDDLVDAANRYCCDKK